MTDWMTVLVTSVTAILIIVAVFWRFSMLIKLIIDRYEDDGKLDEKDFKEIYETAVGTFKWILSIFGVSVDKIIKKSEI